MHITKLGHCCLLIEHNDVRILTDPGLFSVDTHVLDNITFVIITHEHGDHVHVESLQAIIAKNPAVQVITNGGVGALLVEADIPHTIVEGTNSTTIAGVLIEAFDGPHVEIFQNVGQVQNTGYFIDNHLFYPGDAYTNPQKPVPLLALPVAGPWCCVKDVIAYARELKPTTCFPVHDAVLSDAGREITYDIIGSNVNDVTSFEPLSAGKRTEF